MKVNAMSQGERVEKLQKKSISCMRFAARAVFYAAIFSFVSCHSGPEDAGHAVDYSGIVLSKMTIYSIEITLFNKNLALLRKNVVDEITQHHGEITREEFGSINFCVITINMPKNNTADFIAKIKTHGVVINENMQGNYTGEYFSGTEMRLMNVKKMLEKYKELLREATTISDKLLLEKEINGAEMEIEAIEGNKEEMKSRLENNSITIFLRGK
jgi:hypothetical protein